MESLFQGAAYAFQSTYLYKVRPILLTLAYIVTSFNPRTYIRYDKKKYGDKKTNLFQSTYLYKVRQVRPDGPSAQYPFQSTYLYKVRQIRHRIKSRSRSFNPRTYIRYDNNDIIEFNGGGLFQSTYLYKVRLFLFQVLYVFQSFNPRTYIRYDHT